MFVTLKSDHFEITDGETVLSFTTMEEWNAIVEANDFDEIQCSSSLDFPNDETDNEALWEVAANLRGYDVEAIYSMIHDRKLEEAAEANAEANEPTDVIAPAADDTDDFWNEYAEENLSDAERAEANRVRYEAFLKRERKIEKEIRAALRNLVRAYRPGQIRNLQCYSPAGVSEYRVQWLGDHGHEIRSPLMDKAEIAAWIHKVEVEGPCY